MERKLATVLFADLVGSTAIRSLGAARRDSGMMDEAAPAFDELGLEPEDAQRRALGV